MCAYARNKEWEPTDGSHSTSIYEKLIPYDARLMLCSIASLRRLISA